MSRVLTVRTLGQRLSSNSSSFASLTVVSFGGAEPIYVTFKTLVYFSLFQKYNASGTRREWRRRHRSSYLYCYKLSKVDRSLCMHWLDSLRALVRLLRLQGREESSGDTKVRGVTVGTRVQPLYCRNHTLYIHSASVFVLLYQYSTWH